MPGQQHRHAVLSPGHLAAPPLLELVFASTASTGCCRPQPVQDAPPCEHALMLRNMLIVLAAATLPALSLAIAAQPTLGEKHPMVSVMPPDPSLPPPPVPTFPDCSNGCVIKNGSRTLAKPQARPTLADKVSTRAWAKRRSRFQAGSSRWQSGASTGIGAQPGVLDSNGPSLRSPRHAVATAWQAGEPQVAPRLSMRYALMRFSRRRFAARWSAPTASNS